MKCKFCNVLDASNWDGKVSGSVKEYGDSISDVRDHVYMEALLPVEDVRYT